MRDLARRLGRDVLVYGLSSTLVQATSLLTTPIFTRTFSPAEYGVLELLSVGVTLITLLFQSGVDPAAHRLYFEYDALEERRSVVSTGLALVFAVTIAGSLLCGLFSTAIADGLFHTPSLSGLVKIAAFYVPLIVLATSTREMFRLERRPWGYLTSSVAGAFVGGITAVVLVTSSGTGLKGVYIGLGVGALVSIVINVVSVRHLVGFRFSTRELRRMLTYGLPLIPAGIAAWALNVVDRVILTHYRTLEEIGYYGISNRLSNLLLLVVSGFGVAWVPFALALSRDDAAAERRLRGEVLSYYVAGLACLGAALAALAPEAVLLLASAKFLPAAGVVPWLVLGLLFFATTMVTTTGLIVAKRTIEIALCTLAAAVLNVGLCIALIPRHGIGGAAVATAAAYAVQAVLVIWRGQRADRAPFAAGRVAAVFAVAAPYLALGWIHIRPAVLSALVKVAILATLPVVLVATRIVHHGELRRMIDSVRFRMTTRFGRRILEADEEENADVWPPRPSPPPG